MVPRQRVWVLQRGTKIPHAQQGEKNENQESEGKKCNFKVAEKVQGYFSWTEKHESIDKEEEEGHCLISQ